MFLGDVSRRAHIVHYRIYSHFWIYQNSIDMTELMRMLLLLPLFWWGSLSSQFYVEKSPPLAFPQLRITQCVLLGTFFCSNMSLNQWQRSLSRQRFFRCIPLTSKKTSWNSWNISKDGWVPYHYLISLEVIYNISQRRTNSKPSSSPLVAQHHLTVQKSHHRAALEGITCGASRWSFFGISSELCLLSTRVGLG